MPRPAVAAAEPVADLKSLRPVPIRVTRFDEERGLFTEHTHTREVAWWGARVVLKHTVCAEEILRLVNLENHFEGDFRVVGLTRWGEGEPSEWALQCLEKDRTIWGISLPLTRGAEMPLFASRLQCRACRMQEDFGLNTPEELVMNSSGLLVEVCPTCRTSTYWVDADENRRPPTLPFGDVAPRFEVQQRRAPHINTRRHARVPLELPIKIVGPKGDVEHTMTYDVSLEGFAAILHMPLSPGDRVTFVCSHFSAGSRKELTAECVRTERLVEEEQECICGFRVLAGGAIECAPRSGAAT